MTEIMDAIRSRKPDEAAARRHVERVADRPQHASPWLTGMPPAVHRSTAGI
ncbi:hypothetical protein NKH98_16790 [Mesorhizobium sp. M0833]|uniref:hypothetical protein n=1 Tax=Mesorhizobium sp. M0833 TaxID=2957009 RepID=UPI00333DD39E